MRRLASAIAVGACFVAAGACGSDDTGDKNQISGNSNGNTNGGSDGGQSSNGNGNGSGSGVFDGGFGSGNSNRGNNGGDGGCGESPFEATRKPANILLVLDKSRSMDDTPSGFDDDKWTSIQAALDTALNAAKEDAAFGLDLYPVGDETCSLPSDAAPTVSVDEGTTSVPTILSALGGIAPSGGTPTADALDRALEYFTTGAGAALDGEKFVLLATDGGPNCNGDVDPCGADACTVNLDGDCPDAVPGGNCCAEDVDPDGISKCLDTDRTVQRIEALEAAGVTTFVVGIPGSEAYSAQLDAMAEAGGAAQTGDTKYFEVSAMGGVAGLTQVFQDITTELVRTCELQLDDEPPDLQKLNVDVDGERLPRQEEKDVGDGWFLDTSDDSEPPTVHIQGQPCDDIREQGAERINVIFGCPSFRPPE